MSSKVAALRMAQDDVRKRYPKPYYCGKWKTPLYSRFPLPRQKSKDADTLPFTSNSQRFCARSGARLTQVQLAEKLGQPHPDTAPACLMKPTLLWLESIPAPHHYDLRCQKAQRVKTKPPARYTASSRPFAFF